VRKMKMGPHFAHLAHSLTPPLDRLSWLMHQTNGLTINTIFPEMMLCVVINYAWICTFVQADILSKEHNFDYQLYQEQKIIFAFQRKKLFPINWSSVMLSD